MSKITVFIMMLSALITVSVSADIVSTCTHGDKTRVISVVYLEPGSKVPCEVQYQKNQVSKVLWSATNSGGYCEKKAAQFVAKQINWGWQCEETNSDNSVREQLDTQAQVLNQGQEPKDSLLINPKNDAITTTESPKKVIQQVQTEKQKLKNKQRIAQKSAAKQKLKNQVNQSNSSVEPQHFRQAIESVEIIKEMVEEYFNTYGEYPSNFDQLGVRQSDMQSKLLIKSVIVIEKGHIILSGINNKQNKTMLKPSPILGELIHDWSCQTNLKLVEDVQCQYSAEL
jgi:hypothetical protein